MASGKDRVDFATLSGILLAAAAIVGGLLLEKGELKDITQYTAALIVLGGTLGAVLVSTPIRTLKRALKRSATVFLERDRPVEEQIDEIIRFATQARKQGVVSLEDAAGKIADPFLRKALSLAVDGTDMKEIRDIMELEIVQAEHEAEAEAKVFEAAGGYAPTIGIIGAVMGLIQVMKNLANIEEVGHGIAVAFVATVYGVAVANILFLPMANKIKARAHSETLLQELKLEGVLGISDGLNPTLLRSKLEAYNRHAGKPTAGKK